MAPTRIQPQGRNYSRILDYAHRGIVWACIGAAAWGIGIAVLIHRDTMKRNQALLSDEEWVAKRKIELLREAAEKEKAKENDLAILAQRVIPSRVKPPGWQNQNTEPKP
ncbi:hypothetical protein DL96DRAFT_1709244 [Flagelloscypha sp. PMI_526]|nr:hypothetical protein DL96DRAFT_1709244 [Flagelloscypha sp. PMI_526]